MNIVELLSPPGQPDRYDYELAIEVSGQLEEAAVGSAPGCADEAADSIDRIYEDALACKGCELYKTRTRLVPGQGPLTARAVLVGEAPGADEDATGLAFVGRAGKHLTNILTAAGFNRDELYICNILKCRPPENRAPTLEEMKACTVFLRRQLELIKPAIIGCLGNTAVKHIVGPKTPGITQIHGQWLDTIFGIPCMPMYHPSYLLRYTSREKGSPNWQMWQDIQAFKKRYDEIAKQPFE